MPTTTGIATEFIQFSRPGATGGGATVTDSDGKIKWAPHNLLTNSESFDAAAWTKNSTVTANNAAAPNGTTTAELVNEGTASGYKQIQQSVTTLAGVNYTMSIFAKYVSCRWMGLSLFDNNSGTQYAAASFDLLNGVVGSTGAAGTGYAIVGSPTITPFSGGWYLCSVTVTNGTSVANRFAFSPSDVGTIGSSGLNTYTGASNTFQAWGANFYRSDLGGMQPNTSAYPLYNPTTPKNFMGYTEDISAAVWVKTGVTLSVTPVLAPNGLQTADTLVETLGGNSHLVTYNVAFSGLYTFSIYVKAAGRNYCCIVDGNNASLGRIVVDVTNGTVTQNTFSLPCVVTPQSNGFYRISITASLNAAAIQVGPNNTGTIASNYYNDYSGDGFSGITIWGAQLSDSASIDPYVPVYGAAVTSAAYYGPRRDFDGATLACKGLLVEESRTNLASLSNSFSAASWAKDNSSAAVSSATNSPDGLANSSLWYATSSGSVSSARLLREISGTTIGTVYTASIYVKAAGKRWLYFTSPDASSVNHNCWFDIQNGVVGTKGSSVTSASITPCGNSWYRVTTTATATSTSQYFYFSSTNADNSTTVTANATDGFYFYGAQMEAGSFSTSYIPTGSTSATRTYDLATVSTQAFPYSSTEGTLVMATQYAGTNTTSYSYYTGLTSGVGVNDLAAITTDSGTLAARVRSSSSDSLNASFASAAVGGVKKVGIALKVNDFATVLNGGAAQISTTGAMPVGVITLNMNIFNSGAQWIRQITYLPRRVTNAELQTRTA